MKIKTLIYFFVIIFFLLGFYNCTSSIAYLANPWEEDEAQIVIERQDHNNGSIDIYLNNEQIGKMPSNGRYGFIVNQPGTYIMQLGMFLDKSVCSKEVKIKVDSKTKHLFTTRVPDVHGITKNFIIPLEYNNLPYEHMENITIKVSGLEDTIQRVSKDLIENLLEGSTLAVINIASKNKSTLFFVLDELEFQLFDSRKFKIVDRQTLNTIRSEQHFQMSGEVSDSSAVSIGQLLGANIVITGSITEVGTTQRLSLRALDVKTAQIITIVRESF